MKRTPEESKRLLIPLKEAASRLGMCRQTLMRHVYEGDLTCVRFSAKSVHFTPEDLDQFIETHRVRYAPIRVVDL